MATRMAALVGMDTIHAMHALDHLRSGHGARFSTRVATAVSVPPFPTHGGCGTFRAPSRLQWRRSMVNFYELFSKEKREAGRKRLQAEMRKGHFDDFKVLRDTGGKLFRGSPKVLPVGRDGGVEGSLQDVFRGVEVTAFGGGEDGDECGLDETAFGGGREARGDTEGDRSVRKTGDVVVNGATVGLTEVYRDRVRLLAVAVRDGAQPMLDAWIGGWVEGMTQVLEKEDRKRVGVVEMSVVDSFVMGLAPFRGLLFKQVEDRERQGMSQFGGIGRQQVVMFTNSCGYEHVMETFENRLIGYVYLLDQMGRVRWRGCGFPDDEEMGWLVEATRHALKDATE